jgi:hypothetical protein
MSREAVPKGVQAFAKMAPQLWFKRWKQDSHPVFTAPLPDLTSTHPSLNMKKWRTACTAR